MQTRSDSKDTCFISYLQQQADSHSVYVWGAQGQLGPAVNECWIRQAETSETNANRAIAFWWKQVAAGFGDVLRAFDCSGLGMYWLQNVKGLLRYDLSAHGMYNKCEKLTKDRLSVGDFVFKLDKNGHATHIGYIVDTELNVIEARGRDAGVVKLPLTGNTWNAYGRPPFWTEEEVAECGGRFIFTRVLKYGRIGDDICELKKLLVENGFPGLNPKNRNYFGSTRSKVKKFPESKGPGGRRQGRSQDHNRAWGFIYHKNKGTNSLMFAPSLVINQPEDFKKLSSNPS